VQGWPRVGGVGSAQRLSGGPVEPRPGPHLVEVYAKVAEVRVRRICRQPALERRLGTDGHRGRRLVRPVQRPWGEGHHGVGGERLHVCVCRIVRPLGESLHRVGIGDLALRRGRRHWPLEQQGQRADQISLALRALVGQRRRRPLESIGGNLEAGIARVLRGRREEAGALVPVVIGPIREGDAPVRHCTRRVRLSCTLEAGDRLLAVQAEGPHAAPVEQELAFSDSGRNRLRVSAEGGRRGVVVQHVYVSQG